MLRKYFIVSFFLLSILIIVFFSNIFLISKNDLKKYELSEKKKSFEKSNQACMQTLGVKEDLFIAEKNTRNHYCIFSDSSSVSLVKKLQKYELSKNLNNVTFTNEELLSNKIKHVRFASAESGIYIFPYNLNLENVNLSFTYYSQQLQTNFQNQYFSGKGKFLHFFTDKKSPHVEIDGFDGTFTPVKGFQCR